MGNVKKIIGVLGAIGSGKSTVADEFGRLGCGVICADAIVHEMLGDKVVVAKLTERFGREIGLPDGGVDRKSLAEKAFCNAENVEAINAIIHPGVIERSKGLIAQYNADDGVVGIVLDMPLLMEIGWDDRCDVLVFVECDEEIRLERLEKAGLGEKNAKKRENFQISLDKKRKSAHYIVQNNSDTSAVSKQIAAIFSTIFNK